MCLGVPMRIVRFEDEHFAVAEFEQNESRVNISLIESPVAGDYVIVHAGFAIEKLDPDEAVKTIALFKELLAAEQDQEQQ